MKKTCIIAAVISMIIIAATIPRSLYKNTGITYDPDAPTHTPEPYRLTGEGSMKFDLNELSPEVMRLIPGIGKYTDEIVELRDELGGFSSLEQLTLIPGIGPNTVKKAMDYVRLGP